MRCRECGRPHMVERDGICLICHLNVGPTLNRATVTQSRHRRAKWMDAAAVALLMALMMALGVIAWAATAKADGYIDEDEAVYVEAYGQALCDVLDDYYSLSGVMGIYDVIVEQGYPGDSAVDIINASVHEYCPDNWRLLVAIGKAARAGS